MFRQAVEHWVKEVPLALHAIIIFVITIPIFNHAIQPMLISLDPMFAEQSVPLSERSRIAPDTPAEITEMLSIMLFITIYVVIKRKIELKYFDSR